MSESTTRRSNFFASNLMFMILAIVFIASSFIMNMLDVGFKLSIIIIQYGIILVPIFLMMKLRGYNIKKKFRFNKISINVAVKSLLIILFSLPMAYSLNYMVNIILIKLDLFQVQSMDLGTGTFNFFIILLLISVSPGICEEFFFRGMMFSGYRDEMSVKKSIFITGILFGLFHFNLQNLLLPTFLGFILAWLVYTTDSIYSSMLGHGLFNAIGVFLMYNSSDQGATAEELDAGIALLKDNGLGILIGMFIVSALIGLIAIALAKSLKRDMTKYEVGDTIHIDDQKMTVIGIKGTDLIVEDQTGEHTLKLKKLRTLVHEISKRHLDSPVTENSIYEDQNQPITGHGKWHYLFVGVVVMMYIGLLVLNYS